uniref:DDE Tnp4 domain-containing protein n=1 Tax=Cyprinus carpio TaxID=7962 RepID=A0A8C1YIC8_CYPCA
MNMAHCMLRKLRVPQYFNVEHSSYQTVVLYLASGNSVRMLAFHYRMGESTVAKAIKDTCARNIASKFSSRWNFPNCIGVIDGKHILLFAPPHSGSLYFNYKKTFSVVLLAVVDAEYRFRLVHVGEYGWSSDGWSSVFAGLAIGQALDAKKLELPDNQQLPGAEHLGNMPFIIVGDAAFPLKTYLLRPYPGRDISTQQRIFNYRLSRVRNVVENAFGILSSRWRILHSRINIHPDKINSLILSACLLHNFLLKPMEVERLLNTSAPTTGSIENISTAGGPRGAREAYTVQDKFCSFFNSEGRVSWQNEMV